MGANTSSYIASESDDGSGTNPAVKAKLEDIPESCVALVLMHLNPPDICKLARLNRVFRGASSADFIWESKLPSNYTYIIDRTLLDGNGNGNGNGNGRSVVHLGKKQIYAMLCTPNPFDGAPTKEIWIDKSTGGVCLSISSKALTITGIDDRRYWNHIPTEESRFQTVAYLLQTWWLEVTGEFEFQFPAGTYSLFFRLQLGKATKRLGRRVCNPEHVHGWDVKPVQFQLTMSNGQHAVSRCYLDNPGTWVHYHAGDFVIEQPKELTKIRFSLTQIDCTHTKGGLCLDSVFICPNSLGKELISS